MKLGILGALVVFAIPLAAAAQSPAQKKADLEEALRVQQFICNGIVQVRARGGTDYSDGDLVQCLVLLESQRSEYARFVAGAGAQATPAAAPRKAVASTHPTLADARH